MSALAAVFGSVVGLALGLTGGGGSLFAVPLLVFGLSMAPRDAIGASLLSVGAIALLGTVRRIRGGFIVPRAGALMATGGVLCAPFGSWLAQRVPDSALLGGFSLLMVAIAVLMWRNSGRPGNGKEVPAMPREEETPRGIACRFDPRGRLKLTSRCAAGLTVAGALTGLLSGLFGVGGGFLVVPALIFATGMSIHRAVATSLLVIFVVSLSGSIAYLVNRPDVPFGVFAFFVGGGLAGLEVGGRLARRMSGAAMQRGFAVAIVFVGVFVIVKTFFRA
jgi:uncharacterized membrane protein YfcA